MMEEKDITITWYNWKPKPDITIYELALAIPILTLYDGSVIEVMIEDLPEQAQRHFEEIKEE